MLGPGVHSRERFNAPFVKAGLPIPTMQIESNSAPYNRALLATSDFLSYLPQELAFERGRPDEIVTLRVRGVTWDREIAARPTGDAARCRSERKSSSTKCG